mgnify:CR=1 FL=1
MFYLNKKSIFFLVFILLFVSDIFPQKQLRVGYINMEYILSNLDDYNAANKEYNIKLDLWRKEIESRKLSIKDANEELEIKKPLIPDEIYQNLKDEIDFDEKQLNQYIQKRFGPEGDWLIQEKILIQPIQDEVLAIVQKIAEKNKFDFIFDKSSAIIMLYSEKKYDISELVLKSILRQEKIENLQMNFEDEIKQKRRDSLSKVKELRKLSIQNRRDSILNARKNK